MSLLLNAQTGKLLLGTGGKLVYGDGSTVCCCPSCCGGSLPAEMNVSITGKSGCECLTQSVGPFPRQDGREPGTLGAPDFLSPFYAPGAVFTGCDAAGMIDVATFGCVYISEVLRGFAFDPQTLCTVGGNEDITGNSGQRYYLAEILSCNPFHAIVRDIPISDFDPPGPPQAQCCDGLIDVEFTE